MSRTGYLDISGREICDGDIIRGVTKPASGIVEPIEGEVWFDEDWFVSNKFRRYHCCRIWLIDVPLIINR